MAALFFIKKRRKHKQGDAGREREREREIIHLSLFLLFLFFFSFSFLIQKASTLPQAATSTLLCEANVCMGDGVRATYQQPTVKSASVLVCHYYLCVDPAFFVPSSSSTVHTLVYSVCVGASTRAAWIGECNMPHVHGGTSAAGIEIARPRRSPPFSYFKTTHT